MKHLYVYVHLATEEREGMDIPPIQENYVLQPTHQARQSSSAGDIRSNETEGITDAMDWMSCDSDGPRRQETRPGHGKRPLADADAEMPANKRRAW